jgi:hypothetical protein
LFSNLKMSCVSEQGTCPTLSAKIRLVLARFDPILTRSESSRGKRQQSQLFDLRRSCLKQVHVYLHIYCSTSRTRIFHLYGDLTITGEGLQNLGLYSAPLSREGALSCHTCCDTGLSFFRCHSNDRPIPSPFMTHKGMWRTYSNLDLQGWYMYKTDQISHDFLNVKLIRYQFWCTRCAFRLLKSLQWYWGRKSWKSGKKKHCENCIWAEKTKYM